MAERPLWAPSDSFCKMKETERNYWADEFSDAWLHGQADQGERRGNETDACETGPSEWPLDWALASNTVLFLMWLGVPYYRFPGAK